MRPWWKERHFTPEDDGRIRLIGRGTASRYKAYILAAAVLWGGTGVYVKELSALGAQPMQIIFLRNGLAAFGLGLWLLCRDRGALRIRIKDIWCFMGTGLFSMLFFNWCLFRAYQEAGLAISAVLLYTAPAIVALMSSWLFGERLSRTGWGVLALTLLGCALVSGIVGAGAVMSAGAASAGAASAGAASAGAASAGAASVGASVSAGAASASPAAPIYVSLPGILLGLGAGFGYALYSIFGRYALNRGYAPRTISFYTFSLCALGSLVLVSFSAPAPVAAAPGASAAWTSLAALPANPGAWPFALALGSLGCLFPYWLYTEGLSGVTGATASMTATLEPVISALFGVFLYREALSPWQALGMVLILGGILILAKSGAK